MIHSLVARICGFGLLALAVAMTTPAVAQSNYPAIGLSASPDSYVGEIEVPYGEIFTLYVILIGPNASALPFDLSQVEWALLGSCCGGSPAIYGDTIMNENMIHEGDPSFAVTSVADACLVDDLVMLAQVNFSWYYEPTGPFHMGAAALGPVLDCDGEPWIMTGMAMRIVPTGITPAETSTWGSVKSMFR